MSNHQQSTPSTDTKGRLGSVYITRVGTDNSYAFGTALDDTKLVYIPGHLARRLGVIPGDTVEGLLVPNLTQPEKSPWFLRHGHATRSPLTLEEDVTLLVRRMQNLGDAWKVDEVLPWLEAESTAQAYTRAEAALETAHRRGLLSKVLMFHQNGTRVLWFTAVPDQIEVAEFEATDH